MRSWLRKNWNNDTYMILSPRHRFTHLYISHLHQIDHAGVDITIAKIQRKFGIPGVRKIVKSVKYNCVTCKRLSPKCEGQKLGELVEERLKPSPPFNHTACDIFGPFGSMYSDRGPQFEKELRKRSDKCLVNWM